jgi:hypothetical protein
MQTEPSIPAWLDRDRVKRLVTWATAAEAARAVTGVGA